MALLWRCDGVSEAEHDADPTPLEADAGSSSGDAQFADDFTSSFWES